MESNNSSTPGIDNIHFTHTYHGPVKNKNILLLAFNDNMLKCENDKWIIYQAFTTVDQKWVVVT